MPLWSKGRSFSRYNHVKLVLLLRWKIFKKLYKAFRNFCWVLAKLPTFVLQRILEEYCNKGRPEDKFIDDVFSRKIARHVLTLTTLLLKLFLSFLKNNLSILGKWPWFNKTWKINSSNLKKHLLRSFFFTDGWSTRTVDVQGGRAGAPTPPPPLNFYLRITCKPLV